MSLQKQVSSRVMKQVAIATLCSTTFSLGIVGLDANVTAQENEFNCTNATLKGLYGILGTGFQLPTQNALIPFGGIGSRNFDGNGNFSSTGIINVGGTISKLDLPGTYSVKPDCTVEINYTLTSIDNTVQETVQSGIIVDRGREIFVLQTNPAVNVQTAIYKKVR